MDGVLHHVPRVHGLLQAAGDALHGSAATCRGGGGLINMKVREVSERCQHTSTHTRSPFNSPLCPSLDHNVTVVNAMDFPMH